MIAPPDSLDVVSTAFSTYFVVFSGSIIFLCDSYFLTFTFHAIDNERKYLHVEPIIIYIFVDIWW